MYTSRTFVMSEPMLQRTLHPLTQCTRSSTDLYMLCHSVAALVLANRDLQADKQAPEVLNALNINAMTPADVQIQRYEHEKAQMLSALEQALKRQADLQVLAI